MWHTQNNLNTSPDRWSQLLKLNLLGDKALKYASDSSASTYFNFHLWLLWSFWKVVKKKKTTYIFTPYFVQPTVQTSKYLVEYYTSLKHHLQWIFGMFTYKVGHTKITSKELRRVKLILQTIWNSAGRLFNCEIKPCMWSVQITVCDGDKVILWCLFNRSILREREQCCISGLHTHWHEMFAVSWTKVCPCASTEAFLAMFSSEALVLDWWNSFQ